MPPLEGAAELAAEGQPSQAPYKKARTEGPDVTDAGTVVPAAAAALVSPSSVVLAAAAAAAWTGSVALPAAAAGLGERCSSMASTASVTSLGTATSQCKKQPSKPQSASIKKSRLTTFPTTLEEFLALSPEQVKRLRIKEGSCICAHYCNTAACHSYKNPDRPDKPVKECRPQDLAKKVIGCACGGGAECQHGLKVKNPQPGAVKVEPQ